MLGGRLEGAFPNPPPSLPRSRVENLPLRYAQYAIGIFAVSFAAGLVPLLRRWSHRELQLLISMSAGIVLGVVFFDLRPQAVGMSRHFFVAVLAGFVLLLALEKFLLIHPHETEELAGRRSGLAAYAGISLHALIDGVALGSSVMVPALGGAVVWAIVAHKIPDTLSLSSILIFFGFGRRQILWLLLAVALLTPVGGFVALVALRHASPAVLALAMGVAAGTFLFIATSDLLPHAHAHRKGRFRNLVAVLTGLLVSGLLHQTHRH
jgi:zinc and cadmium transporter